MSTIALPVRRRVLADLLPATWVTNALLVVGSAALVGLLAQIAFKLPFTPVPVTGQTLGVMVVGSALGWRRAGAALALYVVVGVAGVPWFASAASGATMYTFGYLVGMVLAAPVLGWLAARGNDRTIPRALVAMVVGDAIVFAVGVPWFGAALHLSASQAVAEGLTPFLWGECIKAAIAGAALPTAWRVVDRATRR